MKTVTADFNRRGPNGTLRVSLRRFAQAPMVDEQFTVVDGEDHFVGTIRSVDRDSRMVIMDMAWEQKSQQYSGLSVSGV